MCGIAGIFSLESSALAPDPLRAMADAIVHRGPDDQGFYHGGRAGLAMRRLSIIGLGNGRQPIASESGDVVLVMNGEIYNYRELRRRLEAQGHRFATDSDVEVAVHLYEEHGVAFVEHLRGMFACAIYDRSRQRLVLARDRAGKKPLYYARVGGLLLFASEIKSLQASGLIDNQMDGEALESYLAHGFVVGPRTLFAGISKLPAGSLLIAEGGRVEARPYWDLPGPAPDEARVDPAAARARVRELLDEAVAVRLMSEVPLGAFLSGGVDSSIVVGLMSRQLAAPVETFSVGFEHPDFDELAYARVAARLYRTRHHELIVSGCSPELLYEINRHHDEPAADPATVPTFCLSRFARQHVTVVLTGEGGDELFAGYRHYRLYRQLTALEKRLSVRPLATVLSGLEPVAGRLGPRRLWKGLWIAALPQAQRPRALVSVFTDREIRRLVAARFRPNGNGYRSAQFGLLQAGAGAIESVAQSMYVDVKSQLPEQLLMKVDKMTMAASLEARCPLLDQHLMEYVAALPLAMKIGASGTKLLLRDAVRGLVPDDLLDRPKHGFEVPIRSWLLGELAPLAQDLLVTPGAALGEYVNRSRVQALWRRLRERDDPQVARQIWVLLNFAIWHDQHWPRLGRRGHETHHAACA